jgi:hypothetical protein
MKRVSLIVYIFVLLLAGCTNEQSVNLPAETRRGDSDIIKSHPPDAESQDTAVLNGQYTMMREKLSVLYDEDIRKNVLAKESRKFLLDSADINNDGKQEFFVFLQGPYFCGSGGCTMLLFNNNAELLSKFTVTSTPVEIANTESHGWKNLVLLSGAKKHLIKNDGKKYPSNPSVAPVYETQEKPVKILFQDAEQYVRFSF